MKKLRLLNFIPLIITIPSITIGAIAMYHNKISIIIWTQNIACFLIAGFISYFAVSNKIKMIRSKTNGIFILIPLLLLILTLISPGMNGVHRWVSIGIINFNVSMIVLPIIIIELWKLSQIKGLRFTVVITMAISILLAIQPDASQLTGFSIPMMIILCSNTNKKCLRTFIVGILSILIILSWVFLDTLPAVDYVERIVNLLANMGLIWLIVGVISLAILPIPFILFPPKNLKLPSICVGLYFIIILVSTLFGNFPIPLMGYGISPVIGYYIPITWYAKSKINS
jgi:cell division protein FtsW (lipid II flippase)